MDSVTENSGQEVSFLQCYICFQNVKLPKMCPSCSKLACENCLRTWIEQSKSECPHCRKPLLLGSFADCQRFVRDIRHLLSSLDSKQKMKQKCMDHRIQMSYYCQDCKDAICSDCGMFGHHRQHRIIHLSKVYQDTKNKILNELAKFDNKIQFFRNHGLSIKQCMQKLLMQVTQKKNFIQEYFFTLIERLDQQYRQAKQRIQSKYDDHVQQIEFLQAFRENICQQLQSKSQKELIAKNGEFINYIRKLYDREIQMEEQSFQFDSIHELVPKYKQFYYVLPNYSQLPQSIVYSEIFELNGIEWRLKIYPRGNGGAKNTHISVFLQLSKGEQNQNKYEYKIEIINHMYPRQSTIRQYFSKFDIGQCWGYNQFIGIAELSNGFLDQQDSLHFNVSIRNPTNRSLVQDQERYIKNLQNRLNCIENPQPRLRKSKMNELVQGQATNEFRPENRPQDYNSKSQEPQAKMLENSSLERYN